MPRRPTFAYLSRHVLRAREHLLRLKEDYRDIGAREHSREEQDASIRGVGAFLLGTAVPAYALLNSLTPVFQELLGYRARTTLAIVGCLLSSWVSFRLIVGKSEKWTLDIGEHLEYQWAKVSRTIAKIALPIAVAMALISLSEIRYFYRSETKFAGTLTIRGEVASEAVVDFLDRDENGVCRCQETDAEGEFFAELAAGGRVVFLKVSTKGETTRCRLPKKLIRGIYDAKKDLVFSRDCSL